MFTPIEQAKPTTVLKENTTSRKMAFSGMDGLFFIKIYMAVLKIVSSVVNILMQPN